jgi:hypothetical protein
MNTTGWEEADRALEPEAGITTAFGRLLTCWAALSGEGLGALGPSDLTRI